MVLALFYCFLNVTVFHLPRVIERERERERERKRNVLVCKSKDVAWFVNIIVVSCACCFCSFNSSYNEFIHF